MMGSCAGAAVVVSAVVAPAVVASAAAGVCVGSAADILQMLPFFSRSVSVLVFFVTTVPVRRLWYLLRWVLIFSMEREICWPVFPSFRSATPVGQGSTDVLPDGAVVSAYQGTRWLLRLSILSERLTCEPRWRIRTVAFLHDVVPRLSLACCNRYIINSLRALVDASHVLPFGRLSVLYAKVPITPTS